MDRGRISGSAVKLAEAASYSDDPWFGQQLHELASELAAMTRQVLDTNRSKQRTSCERWLLARIAPSRSPERGAPARSWRLFARRPHAALSAR